MTNYFLYARKSTDVEDKQVLSIEAQLTELRALAKQQDLNITIEFVEKQSAKSLGRPVFSEMLARIEKGEASGIICWKLDRLARNPVDGGQISWFLQRGIIQHIQTNERSYHSGDNVLLMSVEFGMANQFILDLSANTKRGLREKVRRGWYPALAPVGYLNDKATKTIIMDKPKAKVIKAAFELYAQGNSRLEDIARFMFERGIKTHKTKRQGHKGDMPYSKTKTSYILSNPFYCGLFMYAGELHEGKHQPIISKQLWDKAQEALKARSRPQKPRKDPQALCGLLHCGTCQMMITAEHRVKHQQNGNTHEYVYYRCSRKSKTMKCDERPIRQEELDNQLTTILKDYVLPPEWAEQLNAMADRDDKEAAQSVAAVAQDLRVKIMDIDRKLERLFQGYVSELIEPEQYQTEVNKLKSEKKTLTEQIARLEQRQRVWVEPLKTFIKDARNLGEITLSPELHPKKSFARKIFGLNLVLKNQKIVSVPPTQWAALCAARQKISEMPLSSILVPRRGLEPPRDCSRYHLKVVRIPIPPPGHISSPNFT